MSLAPKKAGEPASVATTYIYLHADLKLKERAMAKTTPFGVPVQRYQPEDKVLEFLNGL